MRRDRRHAKIVAALGTTGLVRTAWFEGARPRSLECGA
jgi:hypothetical protein